MLPSTLLRQVFSHSSLPPLCFHLPGNAKIVCNPCNETPAIDITINKWSVVNLCKPLDVERIFIAFCHGDWETHCLDQLVRVFFKETHLFIKKKPYSYSTLFRKVACRLRQHFVKPTTLQQYLLDPDFCGHWLDESMSHCGVLFAKENEAFHNAKYRNYTRILNQIDSDCRETVLDVNPQWGSFADFAIEKHIRLSILCQQSSQADYVHQRLKHSHAVGEYSIYLKNVPKEISYDAIVSLEHLVQMPYSNWSDYLTTLHSLLRPKGKLLLQTHMRKNVWPDRIASLFFSNCHVPSESDLLTLFHKTGFSLQNTFSMTHSYKKTLEYWLKRIDSQQTYLASHGYDLSTIRSLILLFTLLKAGFELQLIDAYQFTLIRN